nr:trehalase-like domain-containing protein [Geodermatophilus obscurus]
MVDSQLVVEATDTLPQLTCCSKYFAEHVSASTPRVADDRHRAGRARPCDSSRPHVSSRTTPARPTRRALVTSDPAEDDRAEPGPQPRYLPVAEHGLIGDLHTVALVGTNGTIDWYCYPSFDSPSVFGAILDADRGGSFELATASPARTPAVLRPAHQRPADPLLHRRRRGRGPGLHARRPGHGDG